jgi:hypothetical protein
MANVLNDPNELNVKLHLHQRPQNSCCRCLGPLGKVTGFINVPLAFHSKLKGKLSGSWACNVGYDLRIVFDFIKKEVEQGESDILLLEIGSHEEVY